MAIWISVLVLMVFASVFLMWQSNASPNDISIPVIIIAYSPALAAITSVLITQKWRGLKYLLLPILRWKASWLYYGVAVFLPFIIVALAHLLHRATGAETNTPWVDGSIVVAGLGAIIAGSFGEEIGWRGLAQRLLQKRFAVFWASIVVGLLWATWHNWTILAPHGMDGQWLADALLTYVRLIPTAVIYGWLFAASKGSLFIVMVAHAAHNIAVDLFATSDGSLALTALIAAGYFVAGSIVAIAARRTLFQQVL